MVYLREIIEKSKEILFQNNTIELVAYLYVSSPEKIAETEFNLSQDEKISVKCYKHEDIKPDCISSIINKPPIKGISAFSNIFKFSGLYLGAKDELWEMFLEKYNQSNLKQKYFLYKIEPRLKDRLKKETLPSENCYSGIIEVLLGYDKNIEEINNSIQAIIQSDKIDILDIIILEDVEKFLLKTSYDNKTPEEIIRIILQNFSNSVQKITTERRKGHNAFEIKDEYDVQDILYVIFKSIFVEMKCEDPIPKVGGQSTKIDFIFRKENILVETKMIKEKDMNEFGFIQELKIDFESYHKCQWLKKLFCFVYDPFRKTQDVSNFTDLNGKRMKDEHTFDVEVILVC